MAEPKKPQDHKPKTESPKVIVNDDSWDVTHRGVHLVIQKEALNDFELLDDLAALQTDQKKASPRIPMVLRRLAGDDGFRATMDGLRGENGRVPIPETTKFVLEIFRSLNPN